MTTYAVPPRIPVIYTQMLNEYLSVAQTIIQLVQIRQRTVARRFKTDQRLFEREMSKVTATNVLLETQGRASRYELANWIKTRTLVPAGPLESHQTQLQLERTALLAIEKLHLVIVDSRVVPLTKVSGLLLALSKRPITSIRQLADDVLVSEVTAERWLKKCVKAGILFRINYRGQGQYLNGSLIAVVEDLIKIPRFAGLKSIN